MRARQPFNDSRDYKNITHFKLMNSAYATLTARPMTNEDRANEQLALVVVFFCQGQENNNLASM